VADWDARELAQTIAAEDCTEVSNEGIRDINSRLIADESNRLPSTHGGIKNRVGGDPSER
jgi:hypothetical protein